MKRPVGIVLSSILQVLGSLLTFLMGSLALLVPLMQKRLGQGPKLPAAFFYAYAAFYVLLGVLGLATAIGLWKTRYWARVSTLVFAGVLVFFGLICLLLGAFVPMPVPAGAPESARQGVALAKAFLICSSVALGTLGGTWLFYFNRRPIRQLFAGGVTGLPEGGRRWPVSILVLGILNLIGAPWLLVCAWLGLPFQFLGLLAHGRLASAMHLFAAVVTLYIGIGLLRLSPLSRIVAIAYYAYASLSALLFWVLPGRDARFRLLLAESLEMWHLPISGQASQGSSAGLWAGLLFSIAISAVAIYFLVTRRAAFEHGRQAKGQGLAAGSSL